jgi:hypothetical protein
MAVQTVIYLIVLVVLRELGSEELRAAKAIFSVAND